METAAGDPAPAAICLAPLLPPRRGGLFLRLSASADALRAGHLERPPPPPFGSGLCLAPATWHAIPRTLDVAAPDPPRRPCPIRWLGARSRHGRRTPSMRRRPTAGPAAGRPMAPPVHAPGPRAGAAAETAAQGTPLPSGPHRQRHSPTAVLGK